MYIESLAAKNYLSLARLELSPGPLLVLTGPNNAGKSNLVDCFDFISDAYRYGLEYVADEQSLDNIPFAIPGHRSRDFTVGITVRISHNEIYDETGSSEYIRVSNRFTIDPFWDVTTSYRVIRERLSLQFQTKDGQWNPLADIDRSENDVSFGLTLEDNLHRQGAGPLALSTAHRIGIMQQLQFSPTPSELLSKAVGTFVPAVDTFVKRCGDIRVFEFDPDLSREVSAAKDRPELSRYGERIANVVHTLMSAYPEKWERVQSLMREVVPGLRIGVVESGSELRLTFDDTDKWSWDAYQVSDGTIQSLDLLCGLYDPRSPMVVIDEFDQSLHPWIIRRVIDASIEASADKQVLLTTHSPVAISYTPSKYLRIAWRKDRRTHIGKLDDVAGDLQEMWKEGIIDSFQMYDSGEIEETVPRPPITDLE